jgi:di/tricarboxylate transporter
MESEQQPVSMANAPSDQGNPARLIGTGLLIGALAAAMAFAGHVPLLNGMPVSASRAAVLVVFTVGSWALGLFPEPITTLLFFLFAILFRVSPAATIFSGFESPAWWLVFGGAITGIAIRTTGLGSRLSRHVFAISSGSYRSYVSAVVIAFVSLAFVMPSTTGRILLLTPIVLALADRLGLEAGRAGRTGLVMAVAAASYMPPTSILPANIPNSVLLGAADSLYGVRLQYGPYLLLHFPVLGALKSVVLVVLICRLFPDSLPRRQPRNDAPTKLSPGEWRLVCILLLSLLLYATDFAHGISPAWVALGAGIACLLPQAGIVSAKDFTEQLHITPLVYVAGFLGLGSVIAQSGLGSWVSHDLLNRVDMVQGHAGTNLSLLAAIDAGIGFLTTLPGLPAVLTPLAREFSQASGLPLYTVLMLQVPVFSTVFLPYQSPPMMIAMHFGGVRMIDGARLCLASAALTVFALLPLDFLWWRLLGIIQ